MVVLVDVGRWRLMSDRSTVGIVEIVYESIFLFLHRSHTFLTSDLAAKKGGGSYAPCSMVVAGCRVGLNVDTGRLCAKSHNCGIFIFFPDFTMVGGFADRYLLYFVCASSVYRRKYPTSARVFYGGIVGCTVGQICRS
jgi:hypothetical protein